MPKKFFVQKKFMVGEAHSDSWLLTPQCIFMQQMNK